MVKHSISRRLAAMFAVVALSVFALVGAALDVMRGIDGRAYVHHQQFGLQRGSQGAGFAHGIE